MKNEELKDKSSAEGENIVLDLETVTKNSTRMTTVVLKKYYWLGSSFLVLFCCLVLFWLDKDTKAFTDLVQPGNLVALIIYFLPTFLLCSLLYYLFNKRMSWDNSFVLAHFIGIPVGFAGVILLLLWNMGKL